MKLNACAETEVSLRAFACPSIITSPYKHSETSLTYIQNCLIDGKQHYAKERQHNHVRGENQIQQHAHLVVEAKKGYNKHEMFVACAVCACAHVIMYACGCMLESKRRKEHTKKEPELVIAETAVPRHTYTVHVNRTFLSIDRLSNGANIIEYTYALTRFMCIRRVCIPWCRTESWAETAVPRHT